MKIVQVELKSHMNETLTTWVDKRPDLKEGVIISLKDFKPEIEWQVMKIHPLVKDAADFNWHRKWDNNI